MQVSVPLISSWEAEAIPPAHRLEQYAIFFATKRSIADGVARLLPQSELTAKERDEKKRLENELKQLRREALNRQSSKTAESFVPSDQDIPLEDPWHFADGAPITIICSQYPEEDRAKIPHSSPTSADYTSAYQFADLDSLIELYGHLKAANPHSKVNLTVGATEHLFPSHFATHVILLGGVDYNETTKSIVRRVQLPVNQVADWEGEKGPYFEVVEHGDGSRYYPLTEGSGADPLLVQDIGFFYRGINPYKRERTLTICNGMYSRGVYGAVRALTDTDFRNGNAAFLRERFGTAKTYSILMRVHIEGKIAITPDWTSDEIRLHVWSEAPVDGG